MSLKWLFVIQTSSLGKERGQISRTGSSEAVGGGGNGIEGITGGNAASCRL